MIVKIIQKDDEYYSIQELSDDLKKSMRIDDAGVIYTFESIVKGNNEDSKVDKVIFSISDKEKAEEDIKNIIGSAKIKFNIYDVNVIRYVGEFYTGDTIGLVAVLGKHKKETMEALDDILGRIKSEVGFEKEEISKKTNKVIMAGG